MNNNQYIQQYRESKQVWLDNFKKSHDVTSKFLKEHKAFHPHKYSRKNPWYLLLKRESVPICKKLYNRNSINRTELMEGYVQHKLNKWEKNHPCPVQKDDMFYSQQYPEWETEKQNAEEHIRDLIVAKYGKLHLVGRFKSSEEKFQEQEIAQIKDNGDTAKYGGVNNLPEHSKVIKMARKETNKVKAKRGNLICTNLRDHRRKTGRILLPNAYKQMRMTA